MSRKPVRRVIPNLVGIRRPSNRRYEAQDPVGQRRAREIARLLTQDIRLNPRPIMDVDIAPSSSSASSDAPTTTAFDPNLPILPPTLTTAPFVPNAPDPGRRGLGIPILRKREYYRNPTIGMRRRRKRFQGFSRRSFKFLRWLYHNRKKKRFTERQQANALARRQVFFRAWEIARGQGRKYLTGADVKAAQGGAALPFSGTSLSFT